MDGIIKLDPSIAKDCEHIRKGWSERERKKRWKGPRPTEWSVPLVSGEDIEVAEEETRNQ